MNILEWTQNYATYLASFRGGMVKVHEGIVELDGKTKKKYLAMDHLDISSLQHKEFNLVCLNSRSNVQFLLSHWKEFAESKGALIFVHLESSQQWTIIPRTHAAIADEESLDKGIVALHQSIDFYND